ncbi:metal ABC transporter ATP-binding protein [Clostridium swellfunianum]|uniref:metal ABC transporter ATP-binding protein n=1 Tax=Clostridium swellfunianum TaxID=1367462 RepID=UPI00202E4C6E|nr:metal ABC transporter ATP-binding protein [Clostridium swellfunianum]MCM0646963.1 metal ABC transporter ATP-binding protein [Clostridium swellfunianum]
MINIRNLCFSYNSAQPYLLDNINLNIKAGSYVSILGENGSAKSTLIKLILKLLKPHSGSISLRTNMLGYVPQRMESYNSQFPITVNEMLMCHLKTLKLKDKNLITDSLKKVNMLQYKNSLIGTLSGGQQQKIFIARAIMATPKLIILDEPSTGIDIPSQEEIYSFLKKLNKDLGVTIVSVEHNLNAALENSTHIYKMERGNGTLYTVEEWRKIC